MGVFGVGEVGEAGGGWGAGLEEVWAEEGAEFGVVVVEVFLEEGEDFVGEGEVEGFELGGFFADGFGIEEEVGVADLMVLIEEAGDGFVEGFEERGEVNAGEV